jgi:hypothetical protein
MKRRRTTRVGASGKESPENDRGTGPATSVSPALSQVNENEESPNVDQTEGSRIDEGADEFEIEVEYRRRRTGARSMPRRERRQAMRAAHEWRKAALASLKEKRLYKRTSEYFLRKAKLRGLNISVQPP